ncbi:MAG: Flp family type IVb pilin [Armatimonadota bacterium]
MREESCSSGPRGLRALLLDESGVTSVEYALMIAILVVGSIAAFRGLGDVTGNVASEGGGSIPDGSTGSSAASPGASAPPGAR